MVSVAITSCPLPDCNRNPRIGVVQASGGWSRRDAAHMRSVCRRKRGGQDRGAEWWRERTARLAESSSREDPASRRLRVKPGAERRSQAACSLPLAPVSCRRSLSVEVTPWLQLACRNLRLENTSLAQALCPTISPSGTAVGCRRTVPTCISTCTQKCYTHWD